jgi:FixJ family two-component response regulator
LSSAPVIAVVDDDQAIREAMDDLILSYGYERLMFSSAEAFLDWERQDAVDCLIVDVKMPGLSGLQLQTELNRRGTHAPMIFVTSYGDDRTRAAALAGGAAAFFRKPVAIDALIACVETILKRRS